MKWCCMSIIILSTKQFDGEGQALELHVLHQLHLCVLLFTKTWLDFGREVDCMLLPQVATNKLRLRRKKKALSNVNQQLLNYQTSYNINVFKMLAEVPMCHWCELSKSIRNAVWKQGSLFFTFLLVLIWHSPLMFLVLVYNIAFMFFPKAGCLRWVWLYNLMTFEMENICTL